MDISEDALSQRLDELRQLLPNVVSKLAKMGPDNLAKLAADPSKLAMKLVQLKNIFPEANTSRMVAHKMSLILQDDLKDIAAAAGDLSLWPDFEVLCCVGLQDAAIPSITLPFTGYKSVVAACRQAKGYATRCECGQVRCQSQPQVLKHAHA